MTPAGVKYVSTQDSCSSQVSQCMTPAGVKYLQARLLQESGMSECMTPAGVKYVTVVMWDNVAVPLCVWAVPAGAQASRSRP